MATKVAHTLREDKPRLQNQLGCLNGMFHLFDRRYLLGLHRHGPVQNRLTAGEGEMEFKNASGVKKKNNGKNKKKMMIEKNQGSGESSRNSFSSSCSSTTFSSFDCSKRVQTEWQLPPEPTSPNMHNKQPDWSLPHPDIRDVVKESMTREIRVTKNEHARNVMKHIDSPRPFPHQKPVQYDRKDLNLTKIQKISSMVKEVKAIKISRYSCDERESQYSLKSTLRVKEPPRLSLDSKQHSNLNSKSEPGSNKRPSSGVVARLMGLDSLTDSVCEVETLKIKPAFNDQLISNSPRMHSKIKPALQQHEGCYRASKKPSVYGEMEKKLNALEFNTSGKDLRALKQILEAMQMTKTGLKNKEQALDLQKPDQPCSPMVKSTSSPKRRELVNQAMKQDKMITNHHVNHTPKKQLNDPTSKSMKATDTTPSPRLQNSKKGVDKQCCDAPSSDSRGIKKQANLKTKCPKIKHIKPKPNHEQSFSYNNDGDTVSFKSKSKTNLASQGKPDVTRNDQPKENHRNNIPERLIEDKPTDELAKLSVEQPSPVSVLDAFYIEDMPSPIKNKPNVFNNNENLQDDQTGWKQVGIYNSEFSYVNLQNRECPVQQTELLNGIEETDGDHGYIREILLASGFLNDLDSAIRIVQLHPTSSLIKPELFHLLENPNVEDNVSKSNSKIRRKMIFDSVNEILVHKLVNWNGRIYGKFMDGEKLVKELLSEIDVLQHCSKRCLYDADDDDEVKNLVSADVNRKSEEWDKCRDEFPDVVLDIERLVFKDLIDEVVNGEVASMQDRPRRRCRRLFSM